MKRGKLPIIQSPDRALNMLQTRWSEFLNGLLGNPANLGIVLEQIELAAGTNTVPHKLGRVLQGWQVIRRDSAATIYDQQASNPTPELTLVLVASAPVTINLYVF